MRGEEEAARLAERRDGAAWAGTTVVAQAVKDESASREELAATTEAELAANRQAIIDEAQARAEALIDVDAKLGDLDTKYDGVITDAGFLGSRLTAAEQDLEAAAGRLTDAETDITTAFGQITNVDGKATNAAAAASTAQTKADSAKTAADQAATDALAASGIANSKGKTLIQSAPPDAADRNTVTLWIDTTGGANTPKRWSTGTTWVAVTDKAATDAAAAAAGAASAATAAQSTATDAQTAAGTAQATATSALTMAGTKGKVFYDTAAPSGTGTAPGDLWRRIDAAKNVISEWYWTGTAWQSSLITTSAISNLDVGKLTAGDAVIATLVSQKIAAAAGQFIELDVKQLRVTGSGVMDQAVINKLWADVVNAYKITTQMLAVGAFDNVIPDPTFSNAGTDWGSVAAPYSFPPTEGYNAGPAFKVAPNASESGRYSQNVPLTGGEAYRVSVWVKSNVAIPAGALGVYARSTMAGGATVSTNQLKQSSGSAGNDGIAANTWAKLTLMSVFDPAAVYGAFGFFKQATFTTGTVWWSLASATRMNAGELTVDGTVTAQALETELVLATKIVAGDPASTHAEMSPLGFKVFAANPGGGAPTEVVRLGVAATDDYFAVSRADGSLAATISQDGVVVGDQIDATSALWYRGEELQTVLDRMPRGIIAAGYRATSSTVNATFGNIIPYLRIEAVLYPGRIYKVWTSGVKVGLDAGTRVTVGIKYTNSGFATIGSPGLTETATGTDLEAPIVQELFAVGTMQTVSFLIYLQVLNSGQAGFRGSGSVPTRLVVEDVGPARSNLDNGVHMNGTVAPSPPKNTYVRQYGSWNSMNYQGSNAQYAFDTGNMYQGLSPAGYGNLKSISLHPDMTTDLSGATVNYIRVYFNFSHWYNNAGGTARIGLHGHTAIPGSFSGSGIATTSGGWPKPGARWVDLPSSVFAGFKSGAYRGVYLEGDGSYNTYGIAARPTIEISYTK
ncbi:hypothetical protein CVS28_09475 [Arthrobacter glacialis]|nr:hypothetical protein CVS28_09475 [Arthrobacter glacialis]